MQILDEGHRIKNAQAKVLVALEKFTAEHKLILTGTPLQNNMAELWSMLNFLEPEKFNHRPQFLESFGNLQDATQVRAIAMRTGSLTASLSSPSSRRYWRRTFCGA